MENKTLKTGLEKVKSIHCFNIRNQSVSMKSEEQAKLMR